MPWPRQRTAGPLNQRRIVRSSNPNFWNTLCWTSSWPVMASTRFTPLSAIQSMKCVQSSPAMLAAPGARVS